MLIAINPIKERSFKYVKFLGKKKKNKPKDIKSYQYMGKTMGKKKPGLEPNISSVIRFSLPLSHSGVNAPSATFCSV